MKKINFKRIIALICSVTMLLTLMCVNVSAVDYNIDTSQTGSFTIKKTNGANTKNISGVEFKSIKVAEMVQYTSSIGTATTTQLAFYLTDAGKAIFTNIDSTNAIKTDYDIGSGTLVDLYSATYLQSLLDALDQSTLVSTMNTFTTTDGVMTLVTEATTGEVSTGTGLSLGIYIVVETDNTGAYVGSSYSTSTAVEVESAAAPYLVAIPQTDPSTDEWVYNGIVTTPKNIIKATDATKVIVNADGTESQSSTKYSVGDTVDFLITGAISSSDSHQYTSYVITDTPTGISYGTYGTGAATDTNKSTFATITLYESENATTGTELTCDTDYTLVFETDSSGNITKFTITFGAYGLSTLNTIAAASETAYLTVEYSGEVASAATATNAATITYSYGSDPIPDNPPEVEITPHKITLSKLFATDGSTTPVPTEVYFELSDENGDIIYVTKSADGQYVVDTSITDATAAAAAGAVSQMQLTTDATAAPAVQGILVVEGLADGTYYLTEVATSSGYSLLAEPINVTVDGENITLQVTNEKSTIFNLPVTGGLGSLVYTAIGLGCICLAVFMVTKLGRKKKFQ